MSRLAPQEARPATEPESLRQVGPKARRALVTGYTAFYVDMVSLYLPLITLPPALIYFEPPNLSPAQADLLFYLTFGAALISRPLGSMVFGHLADRVGRRVITMVTVGGFSLVTLFIAALPGYASIGLWGYALLILFRLLDGFFLGGEYSATTPLAFEACPRKKRGLYSGILETGYSLGYITIALLTLVVLRIAPTGGIDSPYVQWGWRIPFVAGALLGVLFLVLRSNVPESEVWKKSKKSSSPLKDVLFGKDRRDTYQVLLLTTGFWLSTSAVVSVVPTLLQKHFELSSTTSILTMVIAQACLVVVFVVLGGWSQKVGRRKFIAISTTGMVVVCVPLYLVFASAAATSLGLILTLAVVITVVNGAIWAPLPAYLVERFPTSSRASGYGVGYSVGLILPGFYSFYMLWLGNFMPAQYTAIPLLCVGAALIIGGVLLGPETKDADFATT